MVNSGPLGGLLGAWLQGGLLEASWGPPGGPLGPSKSCCKNWGFFSPRASLTCKTQVKLHVGPLSVPAGGLRPFWTNGPSVFCIFEKARRRPDEARRGATRQVEGAGASDNLGMCIFYWFLRGKMASGDALRGHNVRFPPRLCTKVAVQGFSGPGSTTRADPTGEVGGAPTPPRVGGLG